MIARNLLILFAALAPMPLYAEPPLMVEIVTARAQSETRSYALTGEIQARDTPSAAFPTGGRISEIAVDAGTKVEKGAVLARIDAVQQEQALRAAEAGLLTAEADYQQARQDLDRQEALLQRGATTRAARDAAEDALRLAEGVRGQAEAEAERARKALDDTVLLAPKEATVTERLADPGQIVGAAQPVLSLALGAGIIAVFDVPESLISTNVRPDVVNLSLLDRPEIHFTGQIYEISPIVDAYSGAVTVKVAVTDPPAGLIYGDAVRGTTDHATPPQVVLPYTTVSATEAGPAVWRVDPDTMQVSPQQIVIDRYETGRVILASGVEDGDLIVGRGAQLLFPGRVVAAAKDQ